MKKIILTMMLMLLTTFSYATAYFGKALCAYPQYTCMKITKSQSWDSLFPDPRERDIVQRLNRTYNHLWAGRELAVPKNLSQLTLLDVAPFPLQKKEANEKQIIVDQEKLAWGAYDKDGRLLTWGPISSGRDKCSDSNNSCRTQTGVYRMFSKENEKCRSGVFPIGKGGAKMPYCMYFHKGFALHGSDDMPGVRASHGCVRMFTQDAKWLNENFVELSSERNQFLGTKVIVLPVKATEKKS